MKIEIQENYTIESECCTLDDDVLRHFKHIKEDIIRLDENLKNVLVHINRKYENLKTHGDETESGPLFMSSDDDGSGYEEFLKNVKLTDEDKKQLEVLHSQYNDVERNLKLDNFIRLELYDYGYVYTIDKGDYDIYILEEYNNYIEEISIKDNYMVIKTGLYNIKMDNNNNKLGNLTGRYLFNGLGGMLDFSLMDVN